MTTFIAQISRDLARKYGLEAVQIIQKGGYTTPSGRWVALTEAIACSVQCTVIYSPGMSFMRNNAGNFETQIEVRNETTLSAVQRLLAVGCKPVVLNFASATHPGGGFLNGARAQEEYLARSSGLYACLKDQSMYDLHRQQHDPLYTSTMIYSPAVPVFRADDGALLEEPYGVGMITAAAPNASQLNTDRSVEIEQAFCERIAKVLAIGREQGHDSIVLGAWGCGAFGNDGHLVSQLFREELEHDFQRTYQKVIFAIVDWSDDQKFISPFLETFMQKVVHGS